MPNPYANIIEIFETYHYKTANEYLRSGWVLIHSAVITGTNSLTTGPCYILGWDNSHGKIVYPEFSNAFDKLHELYD